GRSGVFLPQVAEETGWSRDELLSHLCREKAGLSADAWKRGAALYVFTVQAFSSPAPGAHSHVGNSPGT
ncbi:MAG TPA: AMMECR1 domain-containing protein, partial [Armatimonadota bacterium]|nr:AMMECR1 domain-containing protein [Armatimonadota bacterium]